MGVNRGMPMNVPDPGFVDVADRVRFGISEIDE
jgi:hypothetical protein